VSVCVCVCVCSACPRKVFVNEERMSARLHDLHLDNNNVDLHPDLEQAPCYSRRRRPTSVSFHFTIVLYSALGRLIPSRFS